MERKPWHEHAASRLKEFLEDLKSAKTGPGGLNRPSWLMTYSGMRIMLNGANLPKNHDEIRQLVLEIESELGLNNNDLLQFIESEKQLAAAKAAEKANSEKT